jgi:hypothetical protein
MNLPLPTSLRTKLVARLLGLREVLFAATLLATALALGGAVAIRSATPGSVADLPLLLVATVAGAAASLLMSKRRRTLAFRRALGAVVAGLVIASSILLAIHPPGIVSGSSLVNDRWFPTNRVDAPMEYSFYTTSGGRVGAKLPSGADWTVDDSSEAALRASGEGLRVSIEDTAIFPDESIYDVADRLLSELAQESCEVVDGYGYSLNGPRAGVLKEIEVWASESESEWRLLAVYDEGSGRAVAVWISGTYEDLADRGSRLQPTLVTATLDPQRIATLQKEEEAGRKAALQAIDRRNSVEKYAHGKGLAEALKGLRFRGRRIGR